MRITKHLFGIKLGYQVLDLLTAPQLQKIIKKTAGKWGKLVDDRGVGTIVYMINGENIYFQSMIKPVHLSSIEQSIEVDQGSKVKFRVRLPVDLPYIISLFTQKVAENDPTKRELYGYYIKSILNENGMDLESCKVRTLNNDEGLHPTPTLTLFQCGEFYVTAKITDIKKFKKAYAYGIGMFRDLGFGMLHMDVNGCS